MRQFLKLVGDFFITRIQSYAKLLGHIVIFNTLPAPLDQCWTNEARAYNSNIDLGGMGDGGRKHDRISYAKQNTGCLVYIRYIYIVFLNNGQTVPRCFAQYCILVTKKSPTDFTNCLITYRWIVENTWFFQEYKLRS